MNKEIKIDIEMHDTEIDLNSLTTEQTEQHSFFDEDDNQRLNNVLDFLTMVGV